MHLRVERFVNIWLRNQYCQSVRERKGILSSRWGMFECSSSFPRAFFQSGSL
ncbi:hypothetical protein AVEN_64969-1, partial [Araneus ventricosus]